MNAAVPFFVSMLFLIGLAVIIILVRRSRNKKANAIPSLESAVAAMNSPTQVQPVEDPDEIAAVIAAVLAVCQQEQGLVVRSIRRIGNTAPAWNLAGRRASGLS